LPLEITVNTPRIVGILLLVIGAGLLVVGINSSHSVADQVSNTFIGRFTETTTWYILGGVAAGAVGAVMMLAGPTSLNA
jgi:hypothetical protein